MWDATSHRPVDRGLLGKHKKHECSSPWTPPSLQAGAGDPRENCSSAKRRAALCCWFWGETVPGWDWEPPVVPWPFWGRQTLSKRLTILWQPTRSPQAEEKKDFTPCLCCFSSWLEIHCQTSLSPVALYPVSYSEWHTPLCSCMWDKGTCLGGKL